MTTEPEVSWWSRISRRLGRARNDEPKARSEGTESRANRRFRRDACDIDLPITSGGHGFRGVTRVTDGRRWVATDEADRFRSQVDDSAGPDGCWPWLGACTQEGYGQFRVKREGRGWVTVRAHRYAWELANGRRLPSDVTLDHECHTRDRVCTPGVTCPHRRCANPRHVVPVTAAENSRRRHARARLAAGGAS
jgi:hypothetical protein